MACVVLFASFAAAPRGAGAERAAKAAPPDVGRLDGIGGTVQFEPNHGQFDPRVRFYGRGGGVEAFLTDDGATTYVVPDPKRPAKAAAVRMALVGGSPGTAVPSDSLPGVVSYFRGNDPGRWQAGLPTFGRVDVHDVYPGIDLAHRASASGELEYDFVVDPGVSPAGIALSFEGARSVRVNKAGDLELLTAAGTLTMAKPVVYEGDGTPVDGAYRLQGATVGFSVGAYDATETLVIDPVVTLNNLAFSTLLGGSGDDPGRSIAVDAAGNVVVAGGTTSPVFPTTPGAFDRTLNSSDGFVTKLNAAGSALVYSTFVGGGAFDDLHGIAVDAGGNAVVVGTTNSSDFPTSAGAFDTTFNGSADAAVLKLNAAGTAIVYGTFLGSPGSDQGRAVAVDDTGRAFVTGETSSPSFPTTAGAFDVVHNGANDVYVTSIAANGAALSYSTFLGSDSTDLGRAIAVDATGQAHVVGSTFPATSTPFPTTAGAFDTSPNGDSDAYVAKLSASGASLVASTLLGGASSDTGSDLAVDASGVYVAGVTTSNPFPVFSSPFDATFNGGSDFFVTKFGLTLGALAYSTLLGGVSLDGDLGTTLAVDDIGNAYVAGNSLSTDFPTAGAVDTSINGNDDVVVAKLSPNGRELRMGTFVGGTGGDVGAAIAVDSSGNVYVTGNTTTTFPTSATAFQAEHGGGFDAFVFKLGDFSIGGRVVDENGAPVSGERVMLNGPLDGIVTTDSQGWYGFTDTLAGESFTVAPTDGRANPSSHTIASLTRNQRANFSVDFRAPFGDPGTADGQKP